MQIGASAVLGDDSPAHDGVLEQMMWDTTLGMQNLASVPLQDFMSLGRLLQSWKVAVWSPAAQ